jgi:WD40 repeat protein
MSGFTGKVRPIAWSAPTPRAKIPLLAAVSGEDIAIWAKSTDPSVGWTAQALDEHHEVVSAITKLSLTAIAFKPNSRQLASASKDGSVYLWHK